MALPGAYAPASIALRVIGESKPPLHHKAIVPEETLCLLISRKTSKLETKSRKREETGSALTRSYCNRSGAAKLADVNLNLFQIQAS
jgi:hypothetical protein